MLKLFRRKKADPREELREILGDCELPSFPAIVTSALEKVRDEDSSASAIADLIVADPGLSVRLIKTVNSAAFALRHEVKSIHHAVSLMGRNQLESLLISMGVGDALPRKAGTGYDAKRFWTTAARRATTGRALAGLIDPSTRSESFTAALLQDLAIPLLSSRKGADYGELLEQWHHEGGDLAELEQDAFGWNHAGVGECLCQEWDFPEHLAQAIGTHHDVGDGGGALPAVRLVSALREVDEEAGIERLIETARSEYGFDEDTTRGIVNAGVEEAAEIARLFV